MKRRIFAALLCAVMLVSIFPAVLPASAASVEGDWTVYRTPQSYEDEKNGETVKPAPGYRYTADGFTTVEPDWTNFTPYFTVQTKEAQPLKNGIYLEFRVDEYPYGGEDGYVDHWLAFSLSDRENVSPGNIEFGNNWLCLLRGAGEGSASAQSFITTMTTDEDVGTFVHNGDVSVTVPVDDEGREIYTLEIIWDGSEYDIKICGTTVMGCADITAKLDEWNANGEFFVGITVHAGVKDASASLTVTKFGTSASDATKPVGSDSKEPEENNLVEAPIADPSTVEPNKPAILWNPDTVNLKSGNNINFQVQGDNTWLATATETAVFFSLGAKRAWSYNATDFPVFGIMVKNLWIDSGTLWYAAGEIPGATNGYTVPFSIYDGEFYGEDEEYIFVPVDLTDMWEGRFNSIRLDFNMADESTREFELCFAGMFRSVDEAYTYANEWLAGNTEVETKDPNATEPETEPETEAPTEAETEAPTAAPEAGDTTAAPEETEAPKEGCGSVIGFGAVAILAAAAAAVALKKD